MSNTRKDEVLERLVEGISELTTSDRWREYLQVQSRFHRYSFNNTLLIQLQCHEATRAAGFHAWRKLGRLVRKGEKAIWQEIWGYLCCHYAIRTLMWEAADHGGIDPDRVSFVAALRIARRSISAARDLSPSDD